MRVEFALALWLLVFVVASLQPAEPGAEEAADHGPGAATTGLFDGVGKR